MLKITILYMLEITILNNMLKITMEITLKVLYLCLF